MVATDQAFQAAKPARRFILIGLDARNAECCEIMSRESPVNDGRQPSRSDIDFYAASDADSMISIQYRVWRRECEASQGLAEATVSSSCSSSVVRRPSVVERRRVVGPSRRRGQVSGWAQLQEKIPSVVCTRNFIRAMESLGSYALSK